MARRAGKATGKLTALAVEAAKKPGLINDGGGLYLKIDDGGSKSWVLRYKLGGRSHKLGLGPVHTVGLALARDKAADARRLLLDGGDPISEKRRAKAAARLQDARSITFDEVAATYIAAHRAGWRSSKHIKEWSTTLARHASPTFGRLAVQDIDTGLILRALEKVWRTNPETASRVRGRIESVLDYARARGYREGENPARWRGNLDHLLPLASKVKTKTHFAAMPHTEVSGLMAQLAARLEVTSAALAFTISTSVRSGEVLGAQWSEIDLDARLWTIPGSRMKSGREHRVPLSDAAIAILKRMQATRNSDFVFPGAKKNKGLSVTGMSVLLCRTLGYRDATVHGMRSAFRDWASEQTNYPREVCEAALAHVVGDKVEAAYRRTDLLDRRRRLMAEWARYITTPPADASRVIPILRRGK
jgi:integrase